LKLLIITNNPNRPSFRQRVEIYLDTFSQNGIDCDIEELPSGQIHRNRLFHACRNYDGVFLHKKRLNWLNARQLRHHSRRIIYDFDDAVLYSEKKPDHPNGHRRRLFQRTVAMVDCVLAGNTYLADLARPYNRHVEILPTGLNVSEYPKDKKPYRKNDGKIRLVWIGSKSTLCYLATITEALEEIGRRFPHVVLRIICDEFLDLSHLPVEKMPWSLNTQVRDLAQCDIGLAPLPDDPFTRGKCGFKILQYAAASLPVIASPVGLNAELTHSDQTGLLADAAQWPDKLSELIQSPDLQQTMGAKARQNVEKEYDHPILGKKICHIVKQVLLDNRPANGDLAVDS
jgi:glycosyltransferase involved in cell wall biosynthesis